MNKALITAALLAVAITAPFTMSGAQAARTTCTVSAAAGDQNLSPNKVYAEVEQMEDCLHASYFYQYRDAKREIKIARSYLDKYERAMVRDDAPAAREFLQRAHEEARMARLNSDCD